MNFAYKFGQESMQKDLFEDFMKSDDDSEDETQQTLPPKQIIKDSAFQMIFRECEFSQKTVNGNNKKRKFLVRDFDDPLLRFANSVVIRK